jgi:hypothetical protein
MAQDTYVTPTIIPSGTTWSQYKSGGIDIILKNLIATNGPKDDPSAAAIGSIPYGSGGNLPAGTYFIAYTNCDAFGETMIGSSEIASRLTLVEGAILRITMPALPTGVCFRNIYITNPGGMSGTERLYATGVTGTTFDLSYALPSDVRYPVAPRSNTTGAYASQDEITALFKRTSGSIGSNLKQTHGSLLGTSPIPRRDQFMLAYRWAGIFALYNTIADEAAKLVWENMGSWGLVKTPDGLNVVETHTVS